MPCAFVLTVRSTVFAGAGEVFVEEADDVFGAGTGLNDEEEGGEYDQVALSSEVRSERIVSLSAAVAEAEPPLNVPPTTATGTGSLDASPTS